MKVALLGLLQSGKSTILSAISGKAIPPVGALLQISRALELDAGFLLREEEANLKSRIKAFTKRTENYAYTTLTPGAENKHLKAFKVTVDAQQDHKGVGYQHEGEEFVYVLKGNMEIIVGDHVNRLKPGDSLHFNSGIRHKVIISAIPLESKDSRTIKIGLEYRLTVDSNSALQPCLILEVPHSLQLSCMMRPVVEHRWRKLLQVQLDSQFGSAIHLLQLVIYSCAFTQKMV